MILLYNALGMFKRVSNPSDKTPSTNIRILRIVDNNLKADRLIIIGS